jgi:hypothetical protein
MLNAVYTTICTLLKQISRISADRPAATGHGLKKRRRDCDQSKKKEAAYENEKLAF